MANNLLQMAQAASTNVHNNIDNLILKAEQDKLDQTGFMYTDKSPAYIGGVDPVVENIAMGPLLTLKSLGSVGKKLLERTGLRNPVTHYTTGSGATEILKSGTIRGGDQAFPGKPFKADAMTQRMVSGPGGSYTGISYPKSSPAVSVTRDPMFLSRPHGHVGSDIGLIMDRGQLVKQGMKIQPFAEEGYRKTIPLYGGKTLGDIAAGNLYRTGSKMSPRFEFEERVRGYIPTENIRLIDLARLPLEDVDKYKTLIELSKSRTPIIKSFEAKESLQKTLNNIRRARLGRGKSLSQYLREQGVNTQDYIQATEQLLNTPTYRFDPFSRLQ